MDNMKFIILMRTTGWDRHTLRPQLYILQRETPKCWFVFSPKDKFKTSHRMLKKKFAHKLFDDVDEATAWLNKFRTDCGIYLADDLLTQWRLAEKDANEKVMKRINEFN